MSALPLYDPIASLIPHCDPMILIHRVEERGDDFLVASVDLSRPTLFTDADGLVPAYVGLEYMAQTISAYMGAKARDSGLPVKIGFLLGCRKYSARQRHFPKNDILRVQIRVTLMDAEFGAFDCTIFTADNTEFASAQIKAVQPDDLSLFLEAI
jgi:predicted hotdog family 3-hydroxylacyl-ACP dehydratase